MTESRDPSRSHPLSLWAGIAALAVAYFAAGVIGLESPRIAGGVALVWPPAGLGIAALLRFGFRLWPGIALGELLITLYDGATLPVVLTTLVSNPLESLAGAYFLNRLAGFDANLGRVRDVVALFVAATLVPIISATLGVSGMALGGVIGWSGFGPSWGGWYVGNVMGILIAGSALLVLLSGQSGSGRAAPLWESTGVGALLVIINVLIFGGLLPLPATAPLAYAVYPGLIWAGLRSGQRGVVVTVILVSGAALWGTGRGFGPFAIGSVAHQMTHLYAFMAVATLTGLTAGAFAAERARAAGALRESKEHLADLVGSVQAILWRADAETFRFSFVSREAERITGYPAEQWLTEGFWADHIHPDDRAEAVRYCAESTRHKSAHTFEYRMIAADGRVLWVRDVVRVVVERDRPRELVGVIIDITEEKAAEEAIRRSEAQYRALVEHATVGIYRSSVDGRFLSVNPALVQMLGYTSADEMLDLAMARDVYRDPADRARLVMLADQARRIDPTEVEWRRKDGTPITVQLAGHPVRGADGKVESFEMIVEDATERRRLEDQLRHIQKMEALGVLTGGMAHDFNNILTAILANAELAAAAIPTQQQETQDVLKEIKSSATRGAELIRKLLGFSRRERLAPEPIDVAQVVEQLTATLRRLLPETIEIRHAAGPTQPNALADRGAVEQILLNLATNARDAMPDGGTLRIDTERAIIDEAHRATYGWGLAGSYICVSVSDNGCGMDSDTAARAFEPFFTTKPPGAGSGLGLSMVYGLVKQQNGFIHLSSEPGRGTAVRVYLPVTGVTTPMVAAAPAQAVGHGGETILVVDDEEAIRRAAQRVLERHGYTVLVAADGEEALSVYRAHETDISLILTDVVMPRLGGRGLRDALLREGKAPRMLFTSGYSSRDVSELAAVDTAQPFVGKPWVIADLVAKVREVLDT